MIKWNNKIAVNEYSIIGKKHIDKVLKKFNAVPAFVINEEVKYAGQHPKKNSSVEICVFKEVANIIIYPER